MAGLSIGVQIETKLKHEFFALRQSFTGVQRSNVRTPLGQTPFIFYVWRFTFQTDKK